MAPMWLETMQRSFKHNIERCTKAIPSHAVESINHGESSAQRPSQWFDGAVNLNTTTTRKFNLTEPPKIINLQVHGTCKYIHTCAHDTFSKFYIMCACLNGTGFSVAPVAPSTGCIITHTQTCYYNWSGLMGKPKVLVSVHVHKCKSEFELS